MSRPWWRAPQRLPNPEVTRPATICTELPESELVSASSLGAGAFGGDVLRGGLLGGRGSGRGLCRAGPLGRAGLLGGRAGAGVGQLPLDVGRLDQLGRVDQHGGVGGQGGRRRLRGGGRGQGDQRGGDRRGRVGDRLGVGAEDLRRRPAAARWRRGWPAGSAPARVDRRRPAPRPPPRWPRSAAGARRSACRPGATGGRHRPPLPRARTAGASGVRAGPGGSGAVPLPFLPDQPGPIRTPVGGFGTKPPGSGSLSDRCDRAVIDPGATLAARTAGGTRTQRH